MTPTYRLEFSESGGSLEKGIYMRSHRQAWRGRATPKRLQEWVFAYARSLQVGGVNAHISTMLALRTVSRQCKKACAREPEKS